MIEIIAPYLSAISTVLGLTAFLLIIWWAWSKRRSGDFEQAANLPFEQD